MNNVKLKPLMGGRRLIRTRLIHGDVVELKKGHVVSFNHSPALVRITDENKYLEGNYVVINTTKLSNDGIVDAPVQYRIGCLSSDGNHTVNFIKSYTGKVSDDDILPLPWMCKDSSRLTKPLHERSIL